MLPRTDGSAYTLSEAPTPGSGTLMSDYSQSWSCTNAATGSTTPLPSGAGSSVQVAPAPGDDITCTVTNTSCRPICRSPATPTSSTVPPGDDDTYKLVVGNAGPSSATNVGRVVHSCRLGATFVSAGPNCTIRRRHGDVHGRVAGRGWLDVVLGRRQDRGDRPGAADRAGVGDERRPRTPTLPTTRPTR